MRMLLSHRMRLLCLLATLEVAAPSAAERAAALTGWDTDVQFVPTPASAAAHALKWAGVGSGDVFFELGCGDGRVPAEAVRLGASAVCVERDAQLAAEALSCVIVYQEAFFGDAPLPPSIEGALRPGERAMQAARKH